jgi:hypothetical protein
VAAQLSVKTGERFEIRGLAGDPNRHEVRIPTVEVWVGGVRFIHDCKTDEEAMRLAIHVSFDIGFP